MGYRHPELRGKVVWLTMGSDERSMALDSTHPKYNADRRMAAAARRRPERPAVGMYENVWEWSPDPGGAGL